MRFYKQRKPGSYLFRILVAGARPFLYRVRVRRLLGFPVHDGTGVFFAPPVPSVGFRYSSGAFGDVPVASAPLLKGVEVPSLLGGGSVALAEPAIKSMPPVKSSVKSSLKAGGKTSGVVDVGSAIEIPGVSGERIQPVYPSEPIDLNGEPLPEGKLPLVKDDVWPGGSQGFVHEAASGVPVDKKVPDDKKLAGNKMVAFDHDLEVPGGKVVPFDQKVPGSKKVPVNKKNKKVPVNKMSPFDEKSAGNQMIISDHHLEVPGNKAVTFDQKVPVNKMVDKKVSGNKKMMLDQKMSGNEIDVLEQTKEGPVKKRVTAAPEFKTPDLTGMETRITRIRREVPKLNKHTGSTDRQNDGGGEPTTTASGKQPGTTTEKHRPTKTKKTKKTKTTKTTKKMNKSTTMHMSQHFPGSYGSDMSQTSSTAFWDRNCMSRFHLKI